MDGIDYAILGNMAGKLKAYTKLNAPTRKDIQSCVGINTKTLFRRLKKLIEQGYVGAGIKKTPEHTYYVTESGVKALKEVLK